MAEFVKKIIAKLLNRETVTYVIFGALTTLVSISVYTMSINYDMGVARANTVSTVIAVLFAFVTNKMWVFESRDFSIKTTAAEFVKFGAGRVITYLIETGLLMALVDMIGLNAIWCKYFTQGIIIILNYFISKFTVFNK